MNKRLINNRGITLVALVITIIILLILVGVAIGTLGGENGLLSKVNKAKKAQIESEMKENLTLAITELQTEKEGKATLDDITQEWANNVLKDYETAITTDATINGKKIKMTKSSVTGNYIINENLSVTEIQKSASSIEFTYEVKGRTENKVKVSIHIQDKENGISRVEFPDGGIIECFGRTEYAKDNCEVEIGVEYKVKITSKSGETKEEIIYIEPEIEITEPIIGIANPPTSSVADSSQTKGTTLYINFSAALKGTDCTITLKEDTSTTVPYAITSNGKYYFIATGICNGKTVTKEIEVVVKKYQGAQGIVQYDAGDWTESEIQSLQTAGLYNLNASKEASATEGLDFTFGGFTYKGDTTNSRNISNGTIISSRNQSVSSFVGSTEYKPKYSGWQILTSTTKTDENGNVIKNEDGTDRIYITKIVHAGCPENFVYWYATSDDVYRAEYILSSGLRYTDWNTYSPRNWQMYVDNSQKDLIADTKDKDNNTIKDIHAMTYNEALAITGSTGSTTGIRNAGPFYWLGSTYNYERLWCVRDNGEIDWYGNFCWGVRPVVSLKSGVYIKNGDGIEESPYVLGIDE